MTEARYVPAAGRASFTRFYDPVQRYTMRERAWRPQLAEQVMAGSPGAVLDLGCGTGSLTVELERRAGGSRVVAVDGDPDILTRARAKAGPASAIEWHEALAQDLPFEDGAFDRVVTTLVLHHLVPSVKAAALAEARRVLAPGGRLYVADMGRGRGPLMRGLFFVTVRLLDGMESTRDHAAGRLASVIDDAGFENVTAGRRVNTAFGAIELISADRGSQP